MKKTKRVIIALFLAIVMVFGVVGCNAGTQSDLQSKIDGLQSQLEEMEGRLAEMEDQLGERATAIKDLNDRLAEMEDQLSERDAAIKDLNDQITKLKDQIDDLQRQIEDLNDNLAEMEDQIGECDETIKDLNDQITKLKDQIDDLQSQIEDLNDNLAEIEDQIGARDTTIKDLNEQIKKLKEQIEQLEKELAEKSPKEEESMGTFYTLQEAYDNGYLTKEDLEAVVAESKNHSLGLPELAIQQAIKKDYLEMFKKFSPRYPDATVEDIYIWRYYGDYHGSIVVQVSEPYTEYPSVTLECIIADIKIEYSGPDILVWKYN